MGGNLLKTWNLPEKRLNNEEYRNLSNHVMDKLDTYFKQSEKSSVRIGIAESIRNKESHGDLDLFVGRFRNDHRDLNGFDNFVKEEFGYSPSKNSNVYSFPVKGFQVDVTFVNFNDFQSSINYCSWNDTSNLMGRVFHRMGLHYGHIGLSFWIRQGLFDKNCNWSDNDHIYEKLVLTKDMRVICEIGGFDYRVWKNGFDTEEDAFQFVVDSRYFSKDLFAFENLNHINRVRNRKRAMYNRFVEFVSNLPDKTPEFLSKENYAIVFQKRFPQLREAIDKHRFQNSINNCIKEKVSGKIVKEISPDLDGKIIGKVLTEVKGNLTEDGLLNLSPERAKKLIEKACKAAEQL